MVNEAEKPIFEDIQRREIIEEMRAYLFPGNTESLNDKSEINRYIDDTALNIPTSLLILLRRPNRFPVNETFPSFNSAQKTRKEEELYSIHISTVFKGLAMGMVFIEYGDTPYFKYSSKNTIDISSVRKMVEIDLSLITLLKLNSPYNYRNYIYRQRSITDHPFAI